MDLRFQRDKNPTQQGGTAEGRCGNRSGELRATHSTSDTQELGKGEGDYEISKLASRDALPPSRLQPPKPP